MSYQGPYPSLHERGSEIIHRVNHGDGPPCDECKNKAEQVIEMMREEGKK